MGSAQRAAAILVPFRQDCRLVVCALYVCDRQLCLLPLLTGLSAAGLLHCCFEGYFVMNHDRMASSQDVLAQLWKEYALSDSRYLTEDTLVLCLETMTVVSPANAYCD